MKTSVVILTFNSLELNKRCIESVLGQLGVDDEIVVVDNGSQDETPEYLKTLTDKRIKIFLNKTNLGFAAGCNQGARESSGDVLVFLNNDTEVHSGWLSGLKEGLRKRGIGISGSKLVYPDGRIQHAGIVISSDLIPRHIYRLSDPEASFVNKERTFQSLTAASLAIRKDLFNKVGGFDEGYMNGLEDIDLCHRVTALGFKILYCPASVATHYESVAKDRFKHYFRNKERYLSKWPQIISDEDKYYQEDGFGRIYALKQHLNNRYLTGNYREKFKTVFKKVFGISS